MVAADASVVALIPANDTEVGTAPWADSPTRILLDPAALNPDARSVGLWLDLIRHQQGSSIAALALRLREAAAIVGPELHFPVSVDQLVLPSRPNGIQAALKADFSYVDDALRVDVPELGISAVGASRAELLEELGERLDALADYYLPKDPASLTPGARELRDRLQKLVGP